MYTKMRLKELYTLSLVLVLCGGGFIEVEARGSENQIITSLSCDRNNLRISINSQFKEDYLQSDFFAIYDTDINLEEMPYELVTMPLLCNIISLIWISGKTYTIKSMDKNLYKSFKKVKELFCLSYPQTSWKGELVPKKLVKFSKSLPKGNNGKNQRALLFSGGLDSTSSLFHHNNEKLLLITAWGQYDNPLCEPQAWEDRKRHVETIALRYGHRNSFIKSNYAEIFNGKVVNRLSPEIKIWRVSAVDGIGWSGLVAPILFAKKCSALYIASSNSWYYPYIDCINPFIDSSMRFAHYRLLHDQFECTRLDKTVLVVRACEKKNLQKPFLKVCQRTTSCGDANCCECKKCLPTILALCAAGANHRDYGFPVSLKTAVKRSITLLVKDKGVEYETMWNFMDIQLAMKRALTQYDQFMVSSLAPFLEMDLIKANICDKSRMANLKIDWKDFTKKVPSVVMPPNLKDEKREVERKASVSLNSRA